MNGSPSEKMGKRPIILVYLGKRIPLYFKRNIRYLCNSQDREIVLITDNSPKIPLKAAKNLKIIDASVFLDGWTRTHRNSYRSHFWDKTIKRLYILFRFLEKESFLECIHIEGDVWIAPYANLDFELEKSTCLYPEMSKQRGIASVMFIQNEDKKVSREVLKIMSMYPNQTDMQLLGTFFQEKPEMFRRLPSRPILGLNIHELFDGAVLGMHLFGEHARNRIGFYKMFHEYSDVSIDWRAVEFLVNPSTQLILKTGNGEYVINSLHLHSKTHKLFSSKWNKTLVKQLKKKEKFAGETTKFSLLGFLESIFDYSKLLIPYLGKKMRS